MSNKKLESTPFWHNILTSNPVEDCLHPQRLQQSRAQKTLSLSPPEMMRVSVILH